MQFPKAPFTGASARQKTIFVDAVFNSFLEIKASNVILTDDEISKIIPIIVKWLRIAPALSEEDCHKIASSRRLILHIVRSSNINLDNFYELVFGRFQSIMSLSNQYRLKYALMACIDHISLSDISDILTQDTRIATILALQLLDDEPVSNHGLETFNEVLRKIPSIPTITLSLRFLGLLSNTQFMASYGTIHEKYQARRALSALARMMLSASGYLDSEQQSVKGRVDVAPLSHHVTQRPRVLVVAERFVYGNDLYRCFAASIMSLKEYFDVALICDFRARGKDHADIAHTVKYINTENRNGLNEAIQFALQFQPDILFYPSVGMTPWSYALAHIRLAPIQVGSTGTPGPVGSPVMDYQAIQTDIWTEKATLFEQPLLFEAQPQGEGFYTSEWFTKLPKKSIRSLYTSNLTIGINSSAVKLNSDFLESVRTIIKSTDRNIILEFFPSRSGLAYSAIRKQITEFFPSAVVHPSMSYSDYINLLSGCRLILQSFPFGGTNTTIEALLLGIPIVCLAGTEIHSTVDMEILRRCGLDADLLANSRSDYARLAKRLIEDDDTRKTIGERARSAAPRGLISVRKGKTLGMALRGLLAGENELKCGPRG